MDDATSIIERPSPDGLVHAGMGSDLMALCGTMFGCAGHDQVRLSYIDDQVTCVKCLQLRCRKLSSRELEPDNPDHR
jgi:hypothetical protein